MNSEKFKVWYYTKPLWLLLNLFSVLLGKAKRHKYLLPGQKTPYFSSLISYILKTWLVMIFKCLIWSLFPILWASLVTHMVKNLPAMQDQVWSVGQKDPVEKGMTTHSSILAGEFHGQRNLAGYSPWGPKDLDTTKGLTVFSVYSQNLEIKTDTAKALADSLDRADSPIFPYLNTLLRILATRCMMQAVYFCSGMDNDFHHYGLASPIYTHFTSPIRRYIFSLTNER